ncbi:hypothetical protein GCM10007167_03250 [Vulcaniibacterium thermophilum]|uniref:Uncharacterized protein n=1 Tax=Vulcaniibacterium thermophilum TaxID=1169913 RepID=A0A918YUP3_9GAMM|nr:hypothetical protein GCM10007167_03250 [Vulcaniibacterium thermophilum]
MQEARVKSSDLILASIAERLATDPKVNAAPWDQYALVAWYGDGVSKLNGFRYRGDAPGEPATPASFEIEDLLDDLRAATQVEGKGPWRACVVRLDRADGKVTVDFEYERPEVWEVTPATVRRVAERARSADALTPTPRPQHGRGATLP